MSTLPTTRIYTPSLGCAKCYYKQQRAGVQLSPEEKDTLCAKCFSKLICGECQSVYESMHELHTPPGGWDDRDLQCDNCFHEDTKEWIENHNDPEVGIYYKVSKI